MPNHVTHRLVILAPTKERLDAVLEAIKPENATGDDFLSFDRLVPMPEILRSTESSSSVTEGLAILGRTDIPDEFGRHKTLEEMLDYPWVKQAEINDVESLKAFLLERNPKSVEAAEIAIKAFEETGFASWYPWSLANWGVKWDAYSQSLTREDDLKAIAVFDTAWGTPTPILEKIAELFPDITITGGCFDEGWNFACRIKIADGDLEVEDADGQDAMRAIYREVYQEEPETDEDEA